MAQFFRQQRECVHHMLVLLTREPIQTRGYRVDARVEIFVTGDPGPLQRSCERGSRIVSKVLVPLVPVMFHQEKEAMGDKVTLAVIGGTGFYDMEGMRDIEDLAIETPFGPPSDVIRVGTLGGPRLAFLARHGSKLEKDNLAFAQLRSLRKPEPYKGKGVRYENERIIMKEGKKK